MPGYFWAALYICRSGTWNFNLPKAYENSSFTLVRKNGSEDDSEEEVIARVRGT